MKKIFCKHSILIILFILSTEFSFSRNPPIIITGHIEGYTPGESIEVYTFTYFFQSLWNGGGKYYSIAVQDGNFNFEIPAVYQFQYISISFSDIKFMKQNIELFLAESGDHIMMNANENKVIFSGKGAAKYNCQYELTKIASLPPMSLEERKIYGGKRDFKYLENLNSKYDNLNMRRLEKLYSFSKEIEPRAFSRLKLDVEAEKLLSMFQNFYFYLGYPAGKEERKSQLLYYKKKMAFTQIENAPDPKLLLNSKFYTEWLFEKIKLDILVPQYSMSSEVPLKDILNTIEKAYTGLIREKLLITALLKLPPLGDDGLSIVEKVSPFIHHPFFSSLLIHCKGKTKGAAAYDFTLSDENGNKITLSSFKNKTLIMDFWFTGCNFSLDAKKGLKEIKQTMGDTNLIFISVCIDKKRNKWISSLKDSTYNIPGFVNLFTEGLGSNHPLLIKYDYQSVPKILIIDKNKKIFSVMPTRPGSPERNKAFIALIDEARAAK